MESHYINNVTKQWILRVKLSLAMVVIRNKPVGCTGADYAHQLAQTLRSRHRNSKEKYKLAFQAMQTEYSEISVANVPRHQLVCGPSASLRISFQSLQQDSVDQSTCMTVLSAPWNVLTQCPRILQSVLVACSKLQNPQPVLSRCMVLADWTIHSLLYDSQEHFVPSWCSTLRALVLSSVTCIPCVHLILHQLDKLCSNLRASPLQHSLERCSFNAIYFLLSVLECCSGSEDIRLDRQNIISKLERCVRHLSQQLPLLAFYIWHVMDVLQPDETESQRWIRALS